MSETTLDPRGAEQHRLMVEAGALDEMEISSEGWRVFHRYASEFLDAHQAILAGGGITDINDYRMIAGRVQGIQQLLSIPETVRRARDQASEPDERYQDEMTGDE